jgi:putative peptidoglycan lipid II flippase
MITLKAFSEGIIPYLSENFSRTYFVHNFLVIFALCITLNIVIYVFGEEIINVIGPGLEYNAIIVATKSLKIFSFAIYPMLLNSLLSAYLNYLRYYNTVYIGDLIRNFIILFMILFYHFNVYIIPYGWLIGSWVSFVFIVTVFFRNVYKKLNLSHQKIKLTQTGILYSISINFLIYLAVLIDKFFLSYTVPGTIANFSYADSIRSIILATLVTAASRVFLVEFTNNSFTTKKPLINIFIVVTVSAILLFMFSYYISKFLFFRGEIFLEDIKVISNILKFTAISLPFYSLYQILSQKLFSQKKYVYVIKVLIAFLIIKISICYLLFDNLKLYSILLSKVFFEISISLFVLIYFLKNRARKVKLWF